MTVEEKVNEWLNSNEAGYIKNITAFAIKKSTTLTDDEILQNTDSISTKLAEFISSMAELNPDKKDFRSSIVGLSACLASETDTKVDDILVKILDVIF